MNLSICTYGDPILREKAVEVVEVTDEIRALAESMLQTMYRSQGVGLAAEQVGRTEAICVIDIPAESDVDDAENRENPDVKMPLVLINPKILSHGEDVQVGQEGCLSFPEIFVHVERWYEVDFEYTDLEGNRQTAHAKGLLSRAVQHELDHLKAVLLVDQMSQVKKVAMAGRLKRLVKRTKQSLK